MVYIKSLICEGFKSFKEKTKINFSKGFTSIVGANGSGKSNILDAFVFAIGELSGNKMRVNNIKDLICNGGTNGGKASDYTKVDVIFDNSDKGIPVDSDIVKVSRKINLDGKGKYYLNDKVTSRHELLDLLDLALLIPNSSNLILQGELYRIITMNTNERRGLIEELSGIASYNEKKEKAEEDLIIVEDNISKITLLLNEVSIQLDSLEKEKNDALEYQELDLKQKNADHALIIQKLREFENQIEKIKKKIEAIQKEIEEINNKVLEKRNNLQLITSEIDKINEEIKKLQTEELITLTQKLYDLKSEFVKKEILKDNLQTEILKLKKNLIDTINKKDELESKKQNIQKELNKRNEDKSVIKEKLDNLKDEFFHSEEQIKELDTEYNTFNERLDILRNEIAQKNNLKSEQNSEIKINTNKLENLNLHLNSLKEKIYKSNEEVEKFKNEIKILEQKEKDFNNNFGNKVNLDELDEKKRALENYLKKIRIEIEKKQEELISIKSQIKTIKRLSNDKTIEAILQLKNSQDLKTKLNVSGHIYGTIGQLGKTNPEYNVALQVAGGNKFNYVVVDNQETAKNCIKFLSSNKIGRASFIPLDKIKAHNENKNISPNSNIIGRAVELIQFDPLFKNAFEFVFGKSLIVSNLDDASKLELNMRKVTLNGDVVETSNLMTGGAYKSVDQGGFISSEEAKIPTIELELNHLKKEEDSYIKRIKDIETDISLNYKKRISNNNDLSDIKLNLAVLKDNILRKEKDLKDFNVEISKIESEIKNYTINLENEKLKLNEINENLANLINDEKQINSKLSLIENNDFTKKISLLKNEINELEKNCININLDITKLTTQLDEIIIVRESEIKDAINRYQSDFENNTIQIENLTKELCEINKSRTELESIVLQKNQVVGKYYKKKEDLLLNQTNSKLEIEDLKSNIHPKNIKINTLEINLKNLQEQKEELEKNNNINEEVFKNIQEVLAFSQEKLSNIVNECIQEKKKLEPVNMRAIEKYNEIKQRYDDLIKKHENVVDERKSILEFISKIELEKKNAFFNTFNGINDNFKNLFSKLSPEGEAKLELECPEDPFEGGVNILARPGGKKWCLTQSMSGGEKALTVIALVLGIQKFVPSPYYILDEIDAALDDNNASQVGALIKELSENSQFILITHRDVTMTKTDQLLGVSNVNGLTEILNVNIREALEIIAQS